MNLNFFPGLFMFLLGVSPVFADEVADFAQANQRFKAGDFTAAAAGYEKVLAANGPRASVYYNLGNTYQNLKQYGPAILAYERARLLTPRDPDLLTNLAQARKAAAAFEETPWPPALNATLNFLSRNEWSWLVAGCSLFIGVLTVICGAERPGNRRIRKTALATSGVAILLIGIGVTALYLRRNETRRGIILTDSAAVHLSPFEKAESLGTPGPGKTIHMGEKHGDFHYIEVPNTNLHGWLAGKEAEAIAPN